MKTKKKIKILYTIPNFDTAGSGKVVYDLVKNIDRSKFEPEICCFHSEGAFFKEIEQLNVNIHFFHFTCSYYPLISLFSRVWKIRNFFKKNGFDIIHSWHWSSDFTEPLAARLAGIPFVFTKKSMGWGNKAWKIRSFLSSKIIVINSDMKKSFYKNQSDKVIAIPLGVDTRYYKPLAKSNSLMKELGIIPGDKVIISVVNLIPVKGIEVLIKAFLELKIPNKKLLLVGDDSSDYAGQLKLQTKDSTAIQFIGKKLDVRPYLAVSELFVIPTLELGEGLPVAPLEALASNVPVIGSDVPGVRDILSPFSNWMFQPGNEIDLEKKLNSFFTLPEKELALLEIKMRKNVLNNYTIQQFISRHESCYQKLLS